MLQLPHDGRQVIARRALLGRTPLGATLVFGALAVACHHGTKNLAATRGAGPTPSASTGPSPSSSTAVGTRRASAFKGPARFLAVGGGATPESTEVSLEQDIALVERTLPSPGVVLFAGGTGLLSVREIDPTPRGDALLTELGDLFHPRNGRRSRYRAPDLDADRASLENVEARLSSALDANAPPLLLYIAAHGDQGSEPRQNSVALWGGRAFTVERLAQISGEHPRPLRMVATSCYSGGFAEIAFERADEHAGPSRTLRCGLFAGTWDRQTSGCDANPDRREQESYGLHFIHALSATDRAGRPLAPELIDFDHDGHVGLLEAHTRARIAAASLDVPTTTSERWLRSVEHGTAPIDRKVLPEDAAVVEQLGAALGLTDESAVLRRSAELDKKLRDLDDAMDDDDDELAACEATLTSRILERWPVLDDPYHPDFGRTFAKNRTAIEDVLERSPEAEAKNEAARVADDMDAKESVLEVDDARVLRLRRAYETLHKASALMHRGGPAARYYETLLACERSAP